MQLYHPSKARCVYGHKGRSGIAIAGGFVVTSMSLPSNQVGEVTIEGMSSRGGVGPSRVVVHASDLDVLIEALQRARDEFPIGPKVAGLMEVEA